METIQRPELLSPAGDMERLRAALTFGADAVYLAGQEFGMRASQANFSPEALAEAAALCHARKVRLYLTVNTLPRNQEIARLPDWLRMAQAAGVDAVIAADLGVLSLIKQHTPHMEVHISTQAGVVNYQTARAFCELGASRVVLARELSLEEIAEIRARTPKELALEAFVHGAMCMSVSGRCLLSNYLTGRDANRGECAQPCRWSYRLVEEKRPGLYFPIGEDGAGSYILNAKDLCMLEHIPALARAGIDSFKIEGRAKSSYYVSVVTNAYRIAIDGWRKDPEGWTAPPWLLEEVRRVSHRQYSTGFYFGTPDQYPLNGGYERNWDVCALVDGWENGELLLTQKNRFSLGDQVEILEPGAGPWVCRVTGLRDGEGLPLEAARHPQMKLRMDCPRPFRPGSILRQERKEQEG